MAGNEEVGLLDTVARLRVAAYGTAQAMRARLAALPAAAVGRIVAARRLALRGRRAAEDLLDDTAYRVRRDPLRAVAVCFVIGVGLGMLAGWRVTRGGRR
jgi:hypothetical protein